MADDGRRTPPAGRATPPPPAAAATPPTPLATTTAAPDVAATEAEPRKKASPKKAKAAAGATKVKKAPAATTPTSPATGATPDALAGESAAAPPVVRKKKVKPKEGSGTEGKTKKKKAKTKQAGPPSPVAAAALDPLDVETPPATPGGVRSPGAAQPLSGDREEDWTAEFDLDDLGVSPALLPPTAPAIVAPSDAGSGDSSWGDTEGGGMDAAVPQLIGRQADRTQLQAWDDDFDLDEAVPLAGKRGPAAAGAHRAGPSHMTPALSRVRQTLLFGEEPSDGGPGERTAYDTSEPSEAGSESGRSRTSLSTERESSSQDDSISAATSKEDISAYSLGGPRRPSQASLLLDSDDEACIGQVGAEGAAMPPWLTRYYLVVGWPAPTPHAQDWSDLWGDDDAEGVAAAEAAASDATRTRRAALLLRATLSTPAPAAAAGAPATATAPSDAAVRGAQRRRAAVLAGRRSLAGRSFP